MRQPSGGPCPHDPMSIESLLNNQDDTDFQAKDLWRLTGHQEQASETWSQDTQSCQHGPYRHRRHSPDTAALLVGNRSRNFPVTPSRPGYSPLKPVSANLAYRVATAQSPLAPKPSRRKSSSRVHRPKYDQEQAIFIWYYKKDLSQSWSNVVSAFERQFHERRNKGGLQCKYYRTLVEWRVEPVRSQNLSAKGGLADLIPRYGVIERTNKRYTWMNPKHYYARCLPEFEGNQL